MTRREVASNFKSWDMLEIQYIKICVSWTWVEAYPNSFNYPGMICLLRRALHCCMPTLCIAVGHVRLEWCCLIMETHSIQFSTHCAWTHLKATWRLAICCWDDWFILLHSFWLIRQAGQRAWTGRSMWIMKTETAENRCHRSQVLSLFADWPGRKIYQRNPSQ